MRRDREPAAGPKGDLGDCEKHGRWGTLTSWSSFTRCCSCIRTVYSSSHLADRGRREAA